MRVFSFSFAFLNENFPPLEKICRQLSDSLKFREGGNSLLLFGHVATDAVVKVSSTEG